MVNNWVALGTLALRLAGWWVAIGALGRGRLDVARGNTSLFVSSAVTVSAIRGRRCPRVRIGPSVRLPRRATLVSRTRTEQPSKSLFLAT